MTPQQRAELDAKVATILANTEAKNGAPLDQIEEDAIMMAVAQQMQAQWAADEKAQQQAQQQTQQQTQSVSTGGVAGGALSALAGVEHKPVTPSTPVTIPTTVTGIPQNEQEWFEAQKAAQAVDRKAAETQQQRIDDYNRVNKPFLGISRLGGADYTNLDRYNRDIANRENLIIEDTRERNKQAKLANRAEFDKVANAVAQAEMERINANLPDNTQGVSLESVRNSMFPGYKPGHGEYSNEDLLSMLYGAKAPTDYIDAFNSKLTPYMSEEERIAQLNGKPAPKPTNTVGEIPQYSPEQFFNVPQPAPVDASVTASNEPVTVNQVESDAGPSTMNALQGAPQPQSNPLVGQLQPDVNGTRQNTIGVLAGEQAPAAQPARTTTTRATSPVARTTASTQQVVTQQPAQDIALQIGSRGSYIPSTGFTTPNNAGGAQITISPVEFGGDNGGLQYGAMNALYADPKRAPSLGELLAFSSIMQGKKDLGGLDTITATMQSADKMNAYAAQQNIAGRMQQLMQGGASADEARYQAISEEMLRNGQGRGAAAITIPEYAKAADTQAARNLDTAMTAGGDYRANSAFGYTPLGIGSVTANSDGSYNMNVNGQRISGIAPEYARMSVYGAIKGDGSGSKLANDYDYKFNDKMYDTTVDSMKAETEAAKILYDLQRGKYGDASKMSPEQQLQFAWDKAYQSEAGKQKAREEAERRKNQQTPTSGNKTGIDTKWFQENRMATLQQQQAFFRAQLPYAERAAQQLGTHPFNILGQMALESNWGQSLAGAHNYGNIMETRKGVQGVWANDNGNRRQFRNFANDQDYYNHFVGLMGRRYKGVQGAMSPQAYATALKAGGYAEDPNYVQSIGKMYNAVNKVAGTLGGPYQWNGQPTTAVPVMAGNGGGDNIRARPDAGPSTMNALQGAPQPQSNPLVGQLQPDAPQQFYTNTMDSLGGYRIRRPDEWRNGGAQMIVPNGI